MEGEGATAEEGAWDTSGSGLRGRWACVDLPLGRQDGQGLVDLHHDDDEQAASQQKGGPEEREEEALGPIEAPVQDAGLILPSRGEAEEILVLMEPGSDLLHVGPGHLVVVQAAWDVGAL